jgi:hypothetical protein
MRCVCFMFPRVKVEGFVMCTRPTTFLLKDAASAEIGCFGGGCTALALHGLDNRPAESRANKRHSRYNTHLFLGHSYKQALGIHEIRELTTTRYGLVVVLLYPLIFICLGLWCTSSPFAWDFFMLPGPTCSEHNL